MRIEITRPEVEALIEQRFRSGGFADPEELIFQALRAFDAPPSPSPSGQFKNLSDLLLNSPFAGANLQLDRSRDYPRSVEIE